jgi:ferric iron reductase protein FhuF
VLQGYLICIMTTSRTSYRPAHAAALAAALREAAESVGPYQRAYPVFVETPPHMEAVALRDLVEPDQLRAYAARAVSDWSDHPADEDPRAAVSRFARRYLGSLITGVLAPLAHGIGIEAPPERVKAIVQNDLPQGIVLDVDGALLCRERPASWPVDGRELDSLDEVRDRVFGVLVAHLDWLFTRIVATIKVSPQLLWTTAAEQIDLIYDNAADGAAPAVFARAASDRERLLFAESVAGIDGPNPLRDLLYWEVATKGPEAGHRLTVRRMCCANYVVPGRTQGYCRNCDILTAAGRVEMWNEWRASVRAQGKVN